MQFTLADPRVHFFEVRWAESGSNPDKLLFTDFRTKNCTFVAGRKISIYEANPDDFAQQTFKIDFPNQPFVAFAEAGFHK